MKRKIAYLGPDATTNGYVAARTYFGGQRGVEMLPFASHQDICVTVAKQDVDAGVVAIENSIDGFVAESVRAIRKAESQGGIRIQAEVVVGIELYYASKSPTEILPRTVRSHVKALAQCDVFVQALRRKGVAIESTLSTGQAAVEASQDSTVGAITTAIALKKYGLKHILPHSVVNGGSAATRFWVLGKRHAERTGHDKTALLLSLEKDRRAALAMALLCFVAKEEGRGGCYRLKPSQACPNLLVSYPVSIPGKSWEYNWLLEFAGHIDDPAIREGIERFEESGLSLMEPHFLGSYPDKTSALPTRMEGTEVRVRTYA